MRFRGWTCLGCIFEMLACWGRPDDDGGERLFSVVCDADFGAIGGGLKGVIDFEGGGAVCLGSALAEAGGAVYDGARG